MWNLVLRLAVVVGELLIKFGLKKKSESDAQRADALEQTVESVGESLRVEKDIRDKQDAIGDKTVASADGGLDFDTFNGKDGSDA